MRVISVGEILWDVTPRGEFLGGAPFNFAYHLSRLGHNVSFVSAVGNDARGRRVLDRVRRSGISADFISTTADHPTGWVDIQFDASGQPDYVIHRPVAYDFPHLDEAAFRSLTAETADCIYFGTLHQMSATARAVTTRLIEASPNVRCFYDPNLRKNSFTPELVRELLSQATTVKVSEEEAATISGMYGAEFTTVEAFAHDFSRRFAWEALAITRGERGCAVLARGKYAEAEPPPVTAVDPVGAGDAFSAAFLHGTACAWSSAKIANFANRVAALIVSKEGAAPEWSVEELSS